MTSERSTKRVYTYSGMLQRMLSAAVFRRSVMGPWLWYVAYGCQFVSLFRALASISRAIFFQFSQPITTSPTHLSNWFWVPQASRLRLSYPHPPLPCASGGGHRDVSYIPHCSCFRAPRPLGQTTMERPPRIAGFPIHRRCVGVRSSQLSS